MRSSHAHRGANTPALGRTLALVVALVALAGACTYEPDLDPLEPAAAPSVIVSADGVVLATLDGGERREPVTLAAVAPELRDAVVAVEDHRFYDHDGVDLRAVGRALTTNVREGEVVEGGSTITQQYVRMVLLGRERTVSRKLQEAALALEVERRFDKDEILERYLNTAYLGNGAYGVEAAADRYFDLDASDLDLARAALLAGLLQAPERYDPFVHPEAARRRRDRVLDAVAEHGHAPSDAIAAARRAPLGLRPEPEGPRRRAAHFVDRVLEALLDEPALGATAEERRHRIHQGGLRIETTLDTALQSAAEAAVARVLVEPATDPAAALVALDPGTGAVRAWIGGPDYWGDQEAARFDLASQSRRQAGSAFKPFVLAAAVEAGIPLDRTYDAPAEIEIPLPGQAPWLVRNYDGEAAGALDLVRATVVSSNTVYAQLIMDVGAQAAVDLAAAAGVASPLAPNPSAALGTNGVSPLDLANGYATLAADGVRHAPRMVTRIVGPDDAVVWEAPSMRGDAAMAPDTARRVTAVLAQVVDRGTGVAARIGRPVAGKTGTGEEWGDAWFVGYTPDLVAAVWVGFPEGTRSMTPPATRALVTGGGWPAEIWAGFAGTALAETPITTFPEPVDPSGAPRGPRPLTDVVGMPAFPAAALLADAGWVVQTRAVADREYPPGTIVAQDPLARGLTPVGATVTLDVAAGNPARVVVPSLLGRAADDAAAALRAVGLDPHLVVEAEPPPGATERASLAWGQSPPAGTTVDTATTVTVRVNP